MKKFSAHIFVWGFVLCVSSNQSLFADFANGSDMASKARSLQKDAQTRLDTMKSDSGSALCPQAVALQAQKSTADLAVKAHEDAAQAQATACEWTTHAQTLAQAAQKIGDGSASTTDAKSPTKTPAEAKSSSLPASKRLMGK